MSFHQNLEDKKVTHCAAIFSAPRHFSNKSLKPWLPCNVSVPPKSQFCSTRKINLQTRLDLFEKYYHQITVCTFASSRLWKNANFCFKSHSLTFWCTKWQLSILEPSTSKTKYQCFVGRAHLDQLEFRTLGLQILSDTFLVESSSRNAHRWERMIFSKLKLPDCSLRRIFIFLYFK